MQSLVYYSFIAIHWLYGNIEILITNDKKSNLEKLFWKTLCLNVYIS